MSTIEQDKIYLEAGVPELGEYLLSKELFWPLTVRGHQIPRLTLGGVLLAQKRLETRGTRIEALVKQIDSIRSKWRVAWEKKAKREIQARSRLWQIYLMDYRQNPEGFVDAYPNEVRNRVKLQLLKDDLSFPPEEKQILGKLDHVLRTSFIPGDFLWESDLEAGFPREVYWFLYGKLRS